MQGGNARYGHFGRSGGAVGGGGPPPPSSSGASQSDLMFSLSGDVSSSSAALHYQSQHPAFHEGGGAGSQQDPGGGSSGGGPYHARPTQPSPTTTLGFDHHRRQQQQQQLGFDLSPQMQWQAAAGFEMAHHHQHHRAPQPQPQPPPRSSHEFLVPPTGPTVSRGFEPNPRHQPQPQHQHQQPQFQQQQNQQHQHLGGGFEPPPHHREARTVHRQLGFESDSPEPLSSPLSDDPPPPPNPNTTSNINNNIRLGNEHLAPNSSAADPTLGLDDDDDDGNNEGAPEAAHNRWSKKETLALLNVRGQIGAQFRESGAKWPLWEEISRKLAEMGFNKSAKKCKEKFENIQKYYKKTKEGKASRPKRKNYRFFKQLEAIFGGTGVGSMLMNDEGEKNESSMQGNNNTRNMPESLNNQPCGRVPLLSLDERSLGGLPNPTMETDCSSPFSFSSSSSDKSPATEGQKKRKRKASTKKVLQFFDYLMNKVIRRQEQLHQSLLEALEKREKERMAREEAWRRQEMARLGKELQLRSQERALAESRDTALASFLQQATGKRAGGGGVPAPFLSAASPVRPSTLSKEDDDKSSLDLRHKRWPKPEVLALIKLRSTLELRFREPGAKGRAWKDVSREMATLGFNRSAKRCREKWENINRYFLKTRESNKMRLETSKTCPYFNQLDTLYRNGLLSSPQKLALPETSEKQNNNAQEESGQPQQASDSEALATTAAERD